MITDLNFTYILKRNTRGRHLRLSINNSGQITLSVPSRISLRDAKKFLRDKHRWIEKNLQKMRSKIRLPSTTLNYKKNKTRARKLILDRLVQLNNSYHFSWNRLTIRNSRTRWGSCSRQGNLNYNYRIIYLPPELRDYIIVHELCHLREMNHSQKFWTLVEKDIPHYQALKKQLKQYAL